MMNTDDRDHTPAAPAEAPIEEAPTLMKLLRAAWAGDRRIAEAYGTLLADRLDAAEPGGRGRYVRQMLEVLRGERPEVFVRAASSPAPAEVPMPEPYATLHHDDGYFTTKTRDDGKRPRPFRTDVVTLEQCAAYAAAREAAALERVRGVLRNSVETMAWALDLIRMYDEFLLSRGEPHEKVRSEMHLRGLMKADLSLAAARAELGEGR